MMCLIVDSDVRDLFFTQTPTQAALVARRWIEDDGGKLVHGGKLTEELIKSPRAKTELRLWSQSGRAYVYKRSIIEKDVDHLRETKMCKSNDVHVIALARVSGARVLFSNDKTLHEDFKNRELINQPRGSVFQDTDHAKLLAHSPACLHGRGTAAIQ